MSYLVRIIEWSFYLFIFLLPWQTRLIWQDALLNGYVWEYGRFSLYGTQLLLWLTLLCYGFWLVTTKPFTAMPLQLFWQRLRQPAISLYWLTIGLVVVAGLSFLWALDPDIAYYRWLVLVQAVALMSMVIVFNFKFEKIATAWVAAAVVQSLFASWQFFVQYIPANKWLGLAYHVPNLAGSIILQTETERWLRGYGSLPHPNVLAGFLVIALLFLFYLAFQAQTRRERIFILTSLVLITPALFFTFGRSAWIATALCLTLLCFWLRWQKVNHGKETFNQLFWLIVLIVTILSFNLTGPLVTRLQGIEPLEVNSIQLRFTFTQQALQLAQHHPLLGVGIGNYTLGVHREINSAWPGYYYQPVHNIYLLVLAELGVVGAGLFFMLIFGLLWFGVKRANSLEHVIVLLSLIAILIISLFDHYFWTLEFGVFFFWLIIGLNLRQLRPASA